MRNAGHVLVTGATGFLGPYVTRALAAAGLPARRALRDVAAPDGAVAVGSIDGATDWTAALHDVECVVHLAGRAHRPPAVQEAERALYEAINTHGTLALARQAAAAGVRHFVFLSSIAVNGRFTRPGHRFTETQMPAPPTVYAKTKHTAEIGLHEIAAGSGMAVSILRPPLIYGAAAKGSFAMLTRALRLNLPLPLAAIRNCRAFAGAENVAGFVVHRLRQRDASGCETFIVADGEQISTPDFARAIGRALGRPARLIPVPPGMLRGALELAGRSEMREGLVESLQVSVDKARATGWVPLPMDALLRAVFQN